MDRFGQFEPSIHQNLNINFRISDNDYHTIRQLLNIQENNIYHTLNDNTLNKIEIEIFTENRVPYVILNTNLCDRPLKFPIDTGAAISLVANNSIGKTQR